MVRQELQQTKEDLAARNAEVDDLKTRVAELEKLQQDQAALIQLKDSKLAAAEQRLAQSNNAATAAAPANTTKPAQPPEQATTPVWFWGGIGLLVLGLFAWLFMRKRTPEAERVTRRSYDTEAMAAGMPKVAPDPMPEPVVAKPAAPAAAPTPPPFAETGRDTAPRPSATHWTSAPASLGNAPTWHAGTAPGAAGGRESSVAEPETAAQQLELARAYLDMGDDDAARVVLREVLDSRDPAARDAAARLLREL